MAYTWIHIHHFATERYGRELFQQAWAPTPERLARWRVVAMAEQPVRTAVSD